MSTVSERTGVRPAAQVRIREQVRVAVLFGDRQTDLVLPATEAVATVVNEVLAQVVSTGDDVRSPDENELIVPGTVTLKRVGGAVLTRGQSLREQGITDGSLLILDVDDAEVTFTEVIENASSAIAHHNAQRFKSVTAQTALNVAAVTATVAAVIVCGLLLWVWRLDRDAETIETRTLVASSGKLIRAEFEQTMRTWADQLGLRCETIEHPHLLATQVGFTVTGSHRKLEEFAQGLHAEELATIRTERAVMLSPL